MATLAHTTPSLSWMHDRWEKQFIRGAWRTGRSGHKVKDTDPYTGETLVEIAAADRQDLDEAYESARQAQPAWAALLPGQRAGVIRGVVEIMEARRDEIVQLLVRESGSTRIKARLEWESAHAIMLEAASMPYLVEGSVLPGDVPGKECRVYRQPVGVVGVISPWNWPLHLTARSLGPALAVGNSVVVKPSSETPVTGGLLLAKMFEEAGLPPAVLSVVIGSGEEIGDAFVLHAIPRVISFTGSTAVGRHVARLAVDAPIIKRVELELGGNTPFVVLGDADLEQAVEAAVFGRFLHQGQICMSINRVIVDEPVYESFVERFAERVRSLKYGDPNQPDTMVGPIINQRQLDHLREHIEEARCAGFPQLAGGEPNGLVLPPHVFRDVRNHHPLARDELFGPVAPILRAKNEEDALRIANDTEYGLSSAVFTRDLERGARFAVRLEAGMSHVNDQPVNDLPNNPFGGEKNSGLGRFGGIWAVAAFTTDHWVTLQHTPARYPFREQDVMGPSAGG
ncbi:MAG TPA: aldehyde dehydrogenase family protein [Bryobacteraceae bacterium]|jgi:aldehyde dehydrogenase (NAD+)|nr:aldehyde dehydrogenase family protein [Bryobacteraceae bacterium]